MSESNSVIESDWFGLYKEKWAGLIHPDAIAHPAKFARALIRQIYQHAIDEGWLHAGDHVLDCFGGVALGAHDAMRHGLHWTGCELESKFVGLGNQNITLWNESFADRLPVWGSAQLIQGDSRKLSEVLAQVSAGLISSPPFADNNVNIGAVGNTPAMRQQIHNSTKRDSSYGSTDGQLGNMPEGSVDLSRSSPPFGEALSGGGISAARRGEGDYNLTTRMPGGCYQPSEQGTSEGNLATLRAAESDLAAVIASPPYAGSLSSEKNGIDWSKCKPDYDGRVMHDERVALNQKHHTERRYGSGAGQVGAMPEGDISAVIASPPFVESLASDDPDKRGGLFTKDPKRRKDRTLTATYGETDGQLGVMKAGEIDALVSSPPYEATDRNGKRPNAIANLQKKMAEGKLTGRESIRIAEKGAFNQNTENNIGGYGNTDGQLSAERGETFWSASRLILEQCHQVLAPGAHAIFVVKGFVRKKQYVDFPAQWAQLCEAVGFKLLHWHRSWLIEPKGVQHRLDGGEDDLSIARKSFFRLLAERKGSPKIDFEVVLCFERV